MATFHFDLYQTPAIAVIMLLLGTFLRRRIPFLAKFCIPAPVVGGLLFAVVSCALYSAGVVEFAFDETLKNICMVIFFTSVGFQADVRILKRGGVSLAIFLASMAVLIFGQNLLALGLAALMKLNPLVGLSTGSIAMVGGHGFAGAFGPVLEGLGLESGNTLCNAAATFGLVAGSLMGGPVGGWLIDSRDLVKTAVPAEDGPVGETEAEEGQQDSSHHFVSASFQLIIATGIGTFLSWLLSKTGLAFPLYIGSMLTAAVMRNISARSGLFSVHMREINIIGGICLSLFLSIATISQKLWQLASLALPLLVLLVSQALFMFLFARFVVFNVMGRDYDAAIITAGTCGFGLGATPNAMANMQVLTDKYLPSVKAFLLVPIVGGLLNDFLNSVIITFFINLV